MKKFKIAISVLLLVACVVCCELLITTARTNQTNKIEYAELNHVRYGLLSIDTWKTQIAAIVSDEIDKLEFAKTYEKDLKVTVESQLNILIDKVNVRIQKSNKGSAKGWIKQVFMDLFVSIDEIKKGIPQYADAMILEMKKPKSQEQVRSILKEKVNSYVEQTFDTQDMSQVNRIIQETGSKDIAEAKVKLAQEIDKRYDRICFLALTLVVLATILFLIPTFNKGPIEPYQYCSLVLLLFILLAAGVMTPMIDMEAKISQMTFVLMNHPIHFENQVLYFQSKSVLDVFWIMITDDSIQMKFVGILMVLFSIVFPVLKLSSSLAYFYDIKNARDNKWIQFFVLKSGKWSMADVMVVAIFMAYIGFNGIITSQFGKLSTTSEELVVLTTNGTTLQPGYYIFITYALLALFLTSYLTKKPHKA